MKAYVRPTRGLSGHLDPPSSKNYTTRYLLVAALAEGESIVRFPAHSDDATAMRRCLAAFGAHIEDGNDERGPFVRVRGFAGVPENPGTVNPGNAGAVLRLLLGVGAQLGQVRFETDFADSLGKRPHGDLLRALGDLGVESESNDGRLPIVLRGSGLRGGRAWISGAKSSQYLSSLLFMAPLVGEDIEVEVRDGLVSQPLVRTTLEVMHQAGIEIEAAEDLMHFSISGGQSYKAGDYAVNGDYPSSAAILAAGAVAGGAFSINRLFEDSQGERAVLSLLRQMGCLVEHDGRAVFFKSEGLLEGVEFDGDQATDAVLAMVAASTLAAGESRFYGIGNLRLKECDRISVPVRELQALGVDCQEGDEEIIVRGNPAGYEGGVAVETHHDHRVAQMLAIVGMRCRQGLTILNAENVNKSYPAFFTDMISLGAQIEMESE
ncbi:MAG: 3-phosphoshikimate 1-carboxyvinyltransferase [Candidatus Latescibacterota bacterium]|jgi:3-phosphoshikimate 1-carboxyvinyltransferase